MQIRKISFLYFLPLILLPGCELPAEVTKGDTTIVATASRSAVDPAAPENAVCNPFGGTGPSARDQGLRASLYYLDASLPHYDHVAAYVANGTRLDATLFLDQVNVPTRPFDEGFVTSQGEVLKTPAGDTLYEWFALDMESEIRLAAGDAAGRYQFALLSDDGSVATYKDGNVWRTLVNNDGTHATELRVGTAPITFDSTTRLPIKLQYYQGPRMHIAAVMLWRVWPEAAGAWNDPRNGQGGNDLYFDSTKTPSEPKAAYNELLARGWKPLKPGNFFLPSSSPVNPCPPPADDPVVTPDPGAFAISSFDATTTTTSAAVIWSTLGHPTHGGKVYWGTSETSLTNVAVEITGAGETHVASITGLTPASVYYFQAESADGATNTVRSAVIRKTTK